MKSKMLAAVAIAAGLSLAATGTAAAAPLGHPSLDKHKQVAGATLMSGLLAPAAFGDGDFATYVTSTGRTLKTSASGAQVASTSCSAVESFAFTPAFGKTAQAQEDFLNPNTIPDLPFAVPLGVEYVSQFASPGAAATFYNQLHAKYKACLSFMEPNSKPDTVPGGGFLDMSTMSVANTAVSQHRAFWVAQLAADSETSGDTFYINTLVAVAGTNVYEFYEVSGAGDEPSTALMGQLISQVQRLY